MEDKRVQDIYGRYMDDISGKKRSLFKAALEEADDVYYNEMLDLNLKSTSTVMVLSIIFGSLGVDRFYLGDIFIGLLKLFLTIISPILLAVFMMAKVGPVFLPFLYVYVVLDNIIWIVDIFLCRKRAQQKNIEKLMQLLGN